MIFHEAKALYLFSLIFRQLKLTAINDFKPKAIKVKLKIYNGIYCIWL